MFIFSLKKFKNLEYEVDEAMWYLAPGSKSNSVLSTGASNP